MVESFVSDGEQKLVTESHPLRCGEEFCELIMRYLGIDFGSKRVGIAVSDEGNNFAVPKTVLQADRKLLENLKKICQENRITHVVMGQSLDYKMKENKIMVKALEFKKEIETKLGLLVILEPEFLTSAEAERLQGKNEMLDASAAAIILKSYLKKIENR